MNSPTPASFPNLLLILLVALLATAASGETVAGTVAVEVVAETGAWPTDEPIEPSILAVKVRIENHGEKALKLRYRDLALIGFSGDRYSALPIHDLLLAGVKPGDKAKNKVSVAVPKFAQISFRIAPAYSEIFPNSEAYPSHFGETRDNTENRHSQWTSERKPTLGMFARLLPEGVLGAGGYVSGFLYFQRVDGWERGLRFELAVVAADADEVAAMVNVPVTAAENR